MSAKQRHRTTEEEDASALKLGAGKVYAYILALFNSNSSLQFLCEFLEFNNAGCLLISEVKYLLENRDKDAPDTAYVLRDLSLWVILTWC